MKMSYGKMDVKFMYLTTIAGADLPIQESMNLNRSILSLEREYKIFSLAKDKLIRKYGEVFGDRVKILPSSAEFPAYIKELVPIMKIEVDVDYVDPKIPVSSVLADEDFKISVTTLRLMQNEGILTGVYEVLPDPDASKVDALSNLANPINNDKAKLDTITPADIDNNVKVSEMIDISPEETIIISAPIPGTEENYPAENEADLYFPVMGGAGEMEKLK